MRDFLVPLVRTATAELLTDADAARNDYISVILDRSQGSIDAFFARHSIRTLTAEERVRALDLMELERNAMLMYTSCGWFFDDISGIETVQIITYAARVLELAAALFPETRGVLEKRFTDRLAEAKSNDPQWHDGRYIYDEAIRPMVVDLEQVVAHYAISCVFPRAGETSLAERDRLFCYTIAHLWERTMPYGLGQLRLGRVRICFRPDGGMRGGSLWIAPLRGPECLGSSKAHRLTRAGVSGHAGEGDRRRGRCEQSYRGRPAHG